VPARRTRPDSRPSAPKTGQRATRGGKVRKTLWVDPEVLAEAQAILGATSQRETVELALDLVVFRHELVEGTRALYGLQIARFD
jgi:Arc/MetJ family transcription regulator